ncbi:MULTISPECIES: hypothetical protein [Haloferacaceae]|uniref:Uncharacterized protein n=1 Tax=Halorubrum glutamatedens TaxID=2707018 RepID=A0ABD5QNL5_9EURY|nr:hypothetical protein [Halobellus captivus]
MEDEQHWLASLAGTFLGTTVLGAVSEVLIQIDFLLGIICGTILGGLVGIAFMSKRYGKPDSVQQWLFNKADDGWTFVLRVFVATVSFGLFGLFWFAWIVLAHRRFGDATVDYWLESVLLAIVPLSTLALLWFLYRILSE